MKEHSKYYKESNQNNRYWRSPKYLQVEEMVKNYHDDPTDIWINSFGGCRSNWVCDMLHENYNTRCKGYQTKGAHAVRPQKVPVQIGIFCYVPDLGIALSSIEGHIETMWNVYEKLVELKPDEFIDYNMDTYLDLIDQQIDNWTNNPHFPTLILNTDTLEKKETMDLFKTVFGLEGDHKFRARTTKRVLRSFRPWSRKINKISKKLRALPDWELRIPYNTFTQNIDSFILK